MSWVKVECSTGSRYTAPSHGRPPPDFSGSAQLFQHPLSLRRLQTFELSETSGTAEVGNANGCSDGVTVSIVIDQRDLGGHLGITTVIAGMAQAEGEREVDGTGCGSSLVQPGEREYVLRLLLERTFAILSNTNDCGVGVLLDALCTRYPPSSTTEAASRAATVLEDDGGPHVSTALRQARAQLPYNNEGACHANGKAPNQRFLQRITQSSSAILPSSFLNVETTSSLALLPLHSLPEALTPKGAETVRGQLPAAGTPPRPLSFATAVRRQALLFFVEHDVIPLSVLNTQVYYSEAANRKSTTSTAAGVPPGLEGLFPPVESYSKAEEDPTNAGTDSNSTTATAGNVAATVDPLVFLRLLASHVNDSTHRRTVTPRKEKSSLHCSSPLHSRPSKMLERSVTWAAVSRTAEESGQLLLLTVMRLLVHQPLSLNDAAVMMRILLKDMWDDAHTPSEGPLPTTSSLLPAPMVAAFSPSGLLTASSSFRRSMSHADQLLLSAAAVDRLIRFRASSAQLAGSTEKGMRCADVLRWTSWPLRTSGSVCQLVDVLLLTVGDALAICMCFPRATMRDGTSNESPAVVTALSSQGVQQLLERTVAAAGSSKAAGRQANALLSPSLMDSLVFACTHSTKPYTAAFHDALFATTAVETVLNQISCSDESTVAGTREQGLKSGTNVVAAAELHQPLLFRAEGQQWQQQHFGPTVMTSNSTGKPANPATSNSKSRGGFFKLLACLPIHKGRGSSSASSSAAQKACMAESVRQFDVHLHLLESSVNDATISTLQRSGTGMALAGKSPMATLLSLPLECMLCYVAAVVTRNEAGVLRSMHEMGLHSFFYLQQSVATNATHEGRSKSLIPTLCGTRSAQDGKISGDGKRGFPAAPSSPSSVAAVAAWPRFGLSFARHCLQQSPCPSAIVPDEWADVEGMQDGQGDQLTFIEDPTLTLRFATHTKRSHSIPAHGHKTQLPSTVTLLPCWSILHVAPVEPPVATVDGKHYVLKGDDANSLDDSASSAADNVKDANCPASLYEDAQLLTSLSFVLSQKLRRQGIAAGGPAATATSTVAAGNWSSWSAGQTLAALPPPVKLIAAQKAKGKQQEELLADVAVVVNICGDVTQEKAAVILHALQRHSLSAAEKAAVDGKGASTTHDTADAIPFEWEHAATPPAKLKELYREVLLCQEVALSLLEAAACN
jgi:hypothetical protein